MAQPYFTNQPVPIQQVSPELLMAPGRAMGRAFEKLGQSVGVAMERQELKKQKEQQRQSVEAFLLNQGFDPDEANLMSRDKDVAFNASKALREQQQFEQQKKYQNQLMATSRANEQALIQSLTEKKEDTAAEKELWGFLQKGKTRTIPTQETVSERVLDIGARDWQPDLGIDEFIPPTQAAPQQQLISQLTGENRGAINMIDDAMRTVLGQEKSGELTAPKANKAIDRLLNARGKLISDEERISLEPDVARLEEQAKEAMLMQEDDLPIESPILEKEVIREGEEEVEMTDEQILKEAQKTLSPLAYKKFKEKMVGTDALKQLKSQLDIKNKMADLSIKMQKLQSSGDESLSETDGKTWNAITRMDYIEESLEKLGADVGFGSEAAAKFNLNVLKDEDRQIYEAYRDNWIAANLRKESGAAISDTEMKNAREQYFPMIGDSKKTAMAKKKLRLKQREGYYGSLSESTKKKYNKQGKDLIRESIKKKPDADAQSDIRVTDPFQQKSKYTGGVINFQTGQ